MLGVFDSGVGGLTALAALRSRLPRADLCYFADTENAPYGTKSEEVLCRLVTDDILRLRRAGCHKILIACGTASSIYDKLSPSVKAGVLPILTPTARAAARVTENHRIGILATEATVRIGALTAEVKKACPDAFVLPVAAQPLVSLVEEGHTSDRDPSARAVVREALLPFADSGIDTLILGCTHFPRLSALIHRELPRPRLVSASEAGALALLSTLEKKEREGGARLLFLKSTPNGVTP